MTRKAKTKLPAKSLVIDFANTLCVAMFPAIEGKTTATVSLNKTRKQLTRLLKTLNNQDKNGRKTLISDFYASVPQIKDMLHADAAFIADNDPAATCIDEVVMTYPGFFAIMVYRLANKLHNLGIPLIPRIMTEHAHSITGIDIHPGATIGDAFCIDHGTGIVIGESSIIGKRVKIYQGVTIGALSVKKEQATMKRHPTIEDDVIIYAGSTILGGNTVVGRQSIVGGNVWLTESLPPRTIVYQQPNNHIRKR